MIRFGCAVLASWLLSCGLVAADTTVTFDSGAEGWVGPTGVGGTTSIDALGGNPGSNLHTIFSDFGITFRNQTNPDFVGDYSRFANLTLAIDGYSGLEHTYPIFPMYKDVVSLFVESKIAYTPTRDAFSSWKRYRGGRTTPIWIFDVKTQDVEVVPHVNASDSFPTWLNGQV